MHARRNTIYFLLFGFVLLTGFHIVGRLFNDSLALGDDPEKLHLATQTRAVSFGSSVATAIEFDKMCLPGVSLARPGQDRFELTAIANLLLSQEQLPQYWFIVLSPVGQAVDNGSKARGKRQFARKNAYRLAWNQGEYGLIDGDLRTAVSSAVFPSLGHRDWTKNFKRVLGSVALGALTTPRSAERIDRLSQRTREEAEREFVEKTAERAKRAAYYDSGISERSEEQIAGLLTDIRKTGAKPIVVMPPISDTLHKKFGAAMPEEFRRSERLADKYRAIGITVMDYTVDEQFSLRPEMFTDGLHLSKSGKLLFSMTLAEKLRSLELVPPADCSLENG